MKPTDIDCVIALLKKEVRKFADPIVTEMSRQEHNPFKILISTILSLRTKDETTRNASIRLFAAADTPQNMLRLSAAQIEKLIYPVGFYRTKARTILETCRTLIERYAGKVPDTLEELLKLKGVGRKTANLVITLGFDKYGICVDTHVHRISNRLGLIKTKNPEESEFALRKVLPKRYWKVYNDILVTYGQNVCKPISPWCSRCPVESFCDKVDVEKSR